MNEVQEKLMKKDLKYIKDQLSRLDFIDLENEDELNIFSEILDDNVRTTKKYREKPDNFSYKMTSRDSSIIPKSIQEKVVGFMNLGILAEKKKISKLASMSYEDKKALGEKKIELLDFFNTVKKIKENLEEIEINEDMGLNEKSALYMSISEDIMNGFDSDKKIKMKAIRQIEMSLSHQILKNEISLDIKNELNMDSNQNKNSHNRKNKNRIQ